MKTVFSNSMVAHVWASQSQESGRSNNGQFYFEGRRLFSYGRHYVAGYAMPRRDGGTLYMVNSDSYSITTSRHCSEAAYAVPGRAHYVAGLTRLADTLESVFSVWDYPKDSIGRTCPTPRAATMAERKAALPRIKATLAADWPGEEIAAAILAELGQRDAMRAAQRIGRSVAKAKAAEEAKRAKDKRDNAARNAKYMADWSPARLRAEISEILARWSHGDYARDKLQESRRELHRARAEAKARGWTRIAAKLTRHHKAIGAALADFDNRRAAAHRLAHKRGAIKNYREAARNCARLVTPRADGGLSGDGNAATRADWWHRLAESVVSLLKHCGPMLRPASVARLRSIEAAARIKATEEREAANAERFAAEEAARADWLAGGHSRRRLSDKAGGALLRACDVQRDDSGAITGGELETSHGATVPLTHALRAFRFLKHCRATGAAWQRNGRGLRVGHFQLDSVAPNGDFVAGCHRINWAEVARLAESLGVAELAAADTTESTHAPA